MKLPVALVISLLSLSACSKQDDHPLGLSIIKTATKNNLTVTAFSGAWEGSTVHLQFQTSGDLSGISEFQILSGSSNTQLCMIGTLKVSDNASSVEQFSFTDTNPKSSPVFYMIGVKNTNGDITYFNNIVRVSEN